MKRFSRLVFPLVLSLGLFALYYFFDRNESLIDELRLQRKPVLNTLLFVAFLPLIIFVIRLIDLITFDVVISRRQRVNAPLLLRELVSIGLYVILIAWAISKIFDQKVTAFLATGTVVAAVLGLALQETLGNLFAGIALHLEDEFDVGDVVRSGQITGVVESVRWRSTRIRTFNNNLLIVPNSLLARERLEVFPHRNLNAHILRIVLDDTVQPARMIDVLTEAASSVEGVSKSVPCFARVGAFTGSSVTYEIKYFTEDYSQRDRIDGDIRKAVWYALKGGE